MPRPIGSHSCSSKHDVSPLLRRRPTTGAEINLGKRCNQTCRHCHVDASPFRTEAMGRQIVDRCLELIEAPLYQDCRHHRRRTQMHPEFRRIVATIRSMGRHVIDRCNLTILAEGRPRGYGCTLAEHQLKWSPHCLAMDLKT